MHSLIPADDLRVDDLLTEWRWLCPEPVEVLAISAFGEMILKAPGGRVSYLDIHAGTLEPLADSVAECESFLAKESAAEKYLHLGVVKAAAKNGFHLQPGECFTYKTPVVFAQSEPEICALDVYEAVSFLGDIHRQIKDLPEGAKIRLEVK